MPPALPKGTTIRTPEFKLLVTDSDTLQTVLVGDMTREESSERFPLWESLDAFLQSFQHPWWQLQFPEGADEKVVGQIVAAYGLKKAPDQEPSVHLYGTSGSPATQTAEQQMRALEPKLSRWPSLVHHFHSFEEKRRMIRLWQRYVAAYPDAAFKITLGEHS